MTLMRKLPDSQATLDAVIVKNKAKKVTTPISYQDQGCDVERNVNFDTMLPCVTFWRLVTFSIPMVTLFG